MEEPFVLECNGLPAGLRVLAFEGVEEISTTYRYEIDLLVDPDADLSNAVGSTATLTVGREVGAHYTVVHGVLESATVVENLDDMDIYRVVLVPRVGPLFGLDRHSRVFVGEPVPAIVQTLLREAGLSHADCEFRLTRDYDPVDFVCQYRESTLDFLMRWMERDGIYFYFAHEGTQERLVILDDKGRHDQPLVQAPYAKALGLGQEGLRRFRAERRAVPARVRVDDYDYLRPALPVHGEAVVQGGNGGELRVRGAKAATPKEADRIAKLRAEGLRARQTVFHGEGRLLGLHAGEVFTLSGHPRATLDGDYVATKLRVRGHTTGDLGSHVKEVLGREDEPDDVLRVELEAISADVQFRPELRTQPPRVYSMESGVIEGDVESEYAQLDDHGRYLVKFRFDERGGRGSRASARIRMMQPHAGSPEGMHFPLRKGTEVLVAFVGGDPDRPVIAGAVPNALNPAVVHGGNATKNVIHTGGGNRIVMEDTEGKQYIHIASPHKGSYIHIGSPFNPQYNKVTNTTGTSLTYTQDISTSVTGTDAQTIVEDARVTIIGRSQMLPGQSTGNEITALLGNQFVSVEFAQEGDDLVALVAADAEKLAKDTSTLQTALAGSGTPPTISQSSVQAAIEAVSSDLSTLSGDATSYAKAVKQGTVTPPSATYSTTAWQTAIQTAITAAKDLQTAVTGTTPDYSTGATTVTAAQNAVTTSPITFPGSSATQAFLPSPNATPQYILLPHASWHSTTLSVTQGAPSSTAAPEPVDTYIQNPTSASPPGLGEKLEVSDTTALDYLDTASYPNVLGTIVALDQVPPPSPAVGRSVGTAYPLNPGSDVKIVGGDNVTLAANDARSHTLGHAYGLVQAGQTSVVYSPQAFAGAVNWATGGAGAQAAVNQANQEVSAAQNAVVQALEALGIDILMLIPQTALALALGAVAAVAQLTIGNIQGVIATVRQVAAGVAAPLSSQFATLLQSLDGLLIALTAQQVANDNLNNLVSSASNRPSTLPYPVFRSGARLGPGSSVAQTSNVYGDVNSWLDGSTTTVITGNKTATVNGTVRTTIHGDQHTTLADGNNYVTSEIHGKVNSYVLGSRSTEIVGSDATAIIGAQNKIIVGQQGSIVAGIQTELIAALKFSLVAADRWALTVGQNFELHNGKMIMSNMHIQDALAQLYVNQVEMHDAMTSMRTHSIGCVMADLMSFL